MEASQEKGHASCLACCQSAPGVQHSTRHRGGAQRLFCWMFEAWSASLNMIAWFSAYLIPPICKDVLWFYILYYIFLREQWLCIGVSVVCPHKTPLVWKLDEERILTWEGGVVEAPLDPESVWAWSLPYQLCDLGPSHWTSNSLWSGGDSA